MALLFMDGFDYYTDDVIANLRGKWNPAGTFYTTAINSTTGRDGTGKALSLVALGDVKTSWPSTNEIIIGFHFQSRLWQNGNVFYFYKQDTLQMTIGMDAGAHLDVRRAGSTVIGTSTSTFTDDQWYHIECRIKIGNSDGEVELKVDGVGEINITAIDNQDHADAEIETLLIAGDSSIVPIVDNLYIMDTTGSRLNDFLGDCRIETLYPDGVGAAADFTPSAGANWQNVDEVVPDDDTTYNEDTVVSSKDRFTFTDIVSTPDPIHAIAVNVRAKKMVAGPRTIRAIAHDGTTEGEGGDEYFAMGDYMWKQHIFEDHPSGAAVWTAAEVDGGQFGYKIQA